MLLFKKKQFRNYAFIGWSLSSDAVCNVGLFCDSIMDCLTAELRAESYAVIASDYFHSCFFNLIKIPKNGKHVRLGESLHKGVNKQAIQVL